MSDCHDPYRELEHYLAQAEEEIGKAFEDLLRCETEETKDLLGEKCSLLTPPTHQLLRKTVSSPPVSRRLCCNGNVLDINPTPSVVHFSRPPLKKSLSSPSPFFSNICSTNCPNGVFRPRVALCDGPRERNWCTGASAGGPLQWTGGLDFGCPERDFPSKVRARSFSDVTPPVSYLDDDTFSLPPAGDMNLIALWADNLVIEVDRTLGCELQTVDGSPTPESLSNRSRAADFCQENDPKLQGISGSLPCTRVGGGLKNGTVRSRMESLEEVASFSDHNSVVSPGPASCPSPDSGIEQVCFDTYDVSRRPEVSTRDIHVQTVQDELELVDNRMVCGTGEDGAKHIAAQPEINVQSGPGVSTRTDMAPVASPRLQKKGVKNGAEEETKKVNRLARVIPESISECEDTNVQASSCVMMPESSVLPTDSGTPLLQRKLPIPDQQGGSVTPQEAGNWKTVAVTGGWRGSDMSSDVLVVESAMDNRGGRLYTGTEESAKKHFAEPEEKPNTVPRMTTFDRQVSSLPRGRSSSPVSGELERGPQRSASSSAVISLSQVSRHELENFMQRVKTSTYHPPPDSTETNKEDQTDAETQTTPQLSRSSSFTWVTECDCSEWESLVPSASGSEDSLLFFSSCSNADDPIRQMSPTDSSLSLSECSTQSGTLSDIPDQGASSWADSMASSVRRVHTPSKSLDSSPASGRKIQLEEGSRTPEATKSSGDVSALSAGLSASFPKGRKVKGDDDVLSLEDRFLMRDLNAKSASAPLLQPNRPLAATRDDTCKEKSSEGGPAEGAVLKEAKVFVAPRSQSAKELIELQAIEACAWLRAAGFPQYGQMYEDNLFPIDIGTVQKDHAFLDHDSMQSLFRRLNTLNRCARMKIIDTGPRKSVQIEESDEEEQCALSENWQFQRTSRRWSRVPSPPASLTDSSCCPNETSKAYIYSNSPARKYLSPEEAYCSSHDSVFIEEHQSSPDSVRRSAGGEDRTHMLSPVSGEGGSPASSSGSGGISCGSEELLEKALDLHSQLRRTGSERIKEGAKALLRRMESLKGKRKKKKGCGESPGDVHMATVPNSGAEGSPSSSVSQSPQMPHHHLVRGESPPNAETSDGSQGSTPQVKHRKKGWTALCKGEDTNAHSDSECPVLLMSERWKDANFNETKHFVASQTAVSLPNGTGVCNWRSKRDANSYSIHEENSIYSEALREGHHVKKEHWLHPDTCHVKDVEKRRSFYDNIPTQVVVCNRTTTEGERETIIIKHQPFNKEIVHTRKREADDQDALSSGRTGSEQEVNEWHDGESLVITGDRRDSGVGSSLTRHAVEGQILHVPWHCFPILQTSSPRRKSLTSGMSINALSAPQLMFLRKLSLLRLTTLMEKFSPSSRTGWSWGVPKFIRRICTPDYKDKVVFGVPLLLVLQRTGQPLPLPIQAAIRYLRKTALDCTGIFRKSGVRSRIQKLRNQTECCPERMFFDDHQAYDVADMLKQYFRELPEALITNKLSETFISVYQHIPEELRLGAIQAAIMLMPDENREVLQCLLSFLQEICEHARENQMTATNLAVCFAPSLFHLNTPRSASASPRRRKTVGVPDQRELNENKAAYECLTSIILNYQLLFTVSEEQVSHCRLSYLEECEPALLDELTNIPTKGNGDWKAYIDNCVQVLQKEVREKFKGWIVVSQTENSDLAYKKMDDGHPLRLWKVSAEVEAPPVELLNRILRERHIWDSSLLKCRVVSKLDQQTEIFQYVCRSLFPHPPCDYCVLRSWRSDLPKEACVLIEFSLDYPEAPPLLGVRGLVLASRYLIEPCGSGKSRVTHISRVDTRGRSPDWYNKVYGHIVNLQISHLRDSFAHGTDGPETKV